MTVDLEAGDDVTCTFTNTKQVSLTITKVAQPQSPQDFAFSVGLNKIAPVQVLLDDDGDPTDDPDNGQLPNTITGSDLPPGLLHRQRDAGGRLGVDLAVLHPYTHRATRGHKQTPRSPHRPQPGRLGGVHVFEHQGRDAVPESIAHPERNTHADTQANTHPHAAHRGTHDRTHDRTHRRGVGEGFDRCPVRDWAR